MSEAANDNRDPEAGANIAAGRYKCPICGKPATAEAKPFCSKRCADVDLHRWLGESYRLPAYPDDELRDGDEDG